MTVVDLLLRLDLAMPLDPAWVERFEAVRAMHPDAWERLALSKMS
jgi:hypothetical protein